MKLKKTTSFILSLIVALSNFNMCFADTLNTSPEILDENVVSGASVSVKRTKSLAAKSDTDFAYPAEGGYIYFDESSKHITGCDPEVTRVVIPEEIYGVPVIYIGEHAFENCKNLQEVVINGNLINGIQFNAFKNSGIKSIVIPDNVTQLGSEAFANCDELTDVYISKGIYSIGRSAFNGCNKLKNVTGMEGVTDIGSFAFTGCPIESIELPDVLVRINEGVFSGCKFLNNVELPIKLKTIGNRAFANCSSLTEIELPDTVTTLGEEAFNGCTNLKRVVLSNSLKQLQQYTFRHCDNVVSYVIPDSITKIGTDTQMQSGKVNKNSYAYKWAQGKGYKLSSLEDLYKCDLNEDGYATAVDAMLVSQLSTGSLTDENLYSKADINNDGKTTAKDAMLVARFANNAVFSITEQEEK